MRKFLPLLLVGFALIPVVSLRAGAAPERTVRQVMVPEADRFLPFAMTIKAGDIVRWSNGDEDDHAVVSDDAFNTAGHKGVDHVIAPDETFALLFRTPGTFVYYCRFHAHLDAASQPVAPGPDGGIQGTGGNFGTPMSGVITVLP